MDLRTNVLADALLLSNLICKTIFFLLQIFNVTKKLELLTVLCYPTLDASE